MRRAHQSRGVVSVWVVLTAMAMIGMIGLACDLGYSHLVGQQLQHAADAGALGGAEHIRPGQFDQADNQAQTVAGANSAASSSVAVPLNPDNAATGDIILGRYFQRRLPDQPVSRFEPGLTGVNAIYVKTSRPDYEGHAAPLFWGPIFGTNYAHGSRFAIALNYGGTGDAILVLDPNAPRAFWMHGGAILNVIDGGVQVNSENRTAIRGDGVITVNVPDIGVCYDYPPTATPLGSNATFDGNLWPDVDPHPDPLAPLQAYMDQYLTDNPPATLPPLTVPSGSPAFLSPGYYPNGIKWTGGDLYLNPGMYILGGDGFIVTGGNVIGQDIYVYITGGSKTQLTLTGNGIVQLSPVTMGEGAPPWAGVTIHQDIDCRARATINGTDLMNLTGTIYFPSCELFVDGTAESFANQIIANTMELGGNCVLTVPYNGQFAGAGHVFLVE